MMNYQNRLMVVLEKATKIFYDIEVRNGVFEVIEPASYKENHVRNKTILTLAGSEEDEKNLVDLEIEIEIKEEDV